LAIAGVMWLAALVWAEGAALSAPICQVPASSAGLVAGIRESSGLAASRLRPGVYFTLEDSGNKNELLSFDLSGKLLDRHIVVGTSNIDWEDLAAGPCPAPHTTDACLYVADIGDNKAKRTEVIVYAVSEPAAGASTGVQTTWVVRYPTGPHNAETLLVDAAGRLSIVTKDDDGRSGVWALDAPGDIPRLVATLDVRALGARSPKLTGGAWSADGRRLALRTYREVLVWETDPASPVAHWSRAPQLLAGPPEEQGEAVAWSSDGDLLTTSESAIGQMPVHRYQCGGGIP
jgi:hypothetical protein